MVGCIEGDSTPVIVEDGFSEVHPGEAWVCSLQKGDGCYIAHPLEKVEDEYVIHQDEKAVQKEETALNEDEFKIIEKPQTVMMRYRPDLFEKLSRRISRGLYEDGEEEESVVRCLGNDSLASKLFQDPWYAVYLSPDRTTLQLIPCREGGIRSVMRSINIKGLDEIAGEWIGKELKYKVEDGVVTVYFV